MQVDITVDTEALVVDAYPLMREAERGIILDNLDIAWGFYRAMHKAHPEMVVTFTERMMEMLNAVRDIEKATQPDWFTREEREEERFVMREAAMRGYIPPRSMELADEILSRKRGTK